MISYKKKYEIISHLAASDPGNAGWQRDLSVSHNKIGDVRVAQGDLSGAQESFEADLEIAARLAASDPGNAEWQRDVWVSLWRLREFEGSNVSWADILSRIEDMETRGTLLPTDLSFLETARTEAAKEGALAEAPSGADE